MARVFDVPRYEGQALRFGSALLGSVRRIVPDSVARVWGGLPSAAATASALGIDIDSMRAMYEELGIEAPPSVADIEHAAAVGYTHSLEWVVAAGKCFLRMVDFAIKEHGVKSVVSDSDAMFAICYNMWSGGWVVSDTFEGVWASADRAARSLFTVGAAASKVNTVGVTALCRGMGGYKRAAKMFPILARAFEASEGFRYGCDDKESRSAMRDALLQATEPTGEQFRVRKGAISKLLPGVHTYRVGTLVAMCAGGVMYLLDKAALDSLHECLRTPMGFAVYACTYRPSVEGASNRAEAAFRAVHNYTVDAMGKRIHAGKSCASLAKQMKACYSVLLADIGSEEIRKEGYDQGAEILADARKHSLGEPMYIDVLRSLPSGLAVDIGTYWNVLPAPDADAPGMDNRLKKQVNAPRNNCPATQRGLLDYSSAVITAHILVRIRKIPEPEYWELGGIAETADSIDWVKKCSTGVLDYPPREHWGKVRLVGLFKWVEKMECWHYGAQDVTHVFADLEMYSTARTVAVMPRTQTSELGYALVSGPVLSGKYKPEDVRRSARDGKLLGDRVLVLAGKGENTKGGESARETASADDITREMLSELDSNLGQVAACVHGAAMRMGRVSFERRINRMRMATSAGHLLLSLDVSGWSPNMDRRLEMGFLDMLMGFFDIPKEMRVGTWFRDINVVHSRRGFHSVWDMHDGSIQGFFGTGDTIMHNMMAQYAVVRCREEGVMGASVKATYVALIDDLAMKIFSGDAQALPILRSMSNTYKLLGSTADLVKTLGSRHKFHFLNRLFSDEGEVITSAKIFAKADREHSRRLSGVFSQMDSSMGAVLGAVDRGACPMAGYLWALTLVMAVALRMDGRICEKRGELYAFGAWLPRQLGGWGIRSLHSWVTQEGGDALADGLCTIDRFRRLIVTSDSAWHQSISSLLRSVSGAKLERRSIVAAMSDPFGIRCPVAVDVEAPGRKLLREGARRMVTAKDFVSLMNATESKAYERVLASVGAAWTLPAGVWQALSETMPHSVIDQILVRAERNEIVMMGLPAVARHKAINEIRDNGKQAIRSFVYWGSIAADRHAVADLPPMLALVEELRVRQVTLDGLNTTDLDTTPGLEAITLARGSGSVVAIVPKVTPDTVHDGDGSRSLVRSVVSKGIIDDRMPARLGTDPILRAAAKSATIASAVKSLGIDERPVSELWSLLWLGPSVSAKPPEVSVRVTDPARVSRQLSRRTHSTMCLPNLSGGIVVNANTAISFWEGQRKTFDWMSVVFSAKAVAALDTVAGGGMGANGMIRDRDVTLYEFDLSCRFRTIRPLSTWVTTPLSQAAPSSGDYPGALTGAGAKRVIGSLQDVWSVAAAELDVVDDTDGPTGAREAGISEGTWNAAVYAPARALRPRDVLRARDMPNLPGSRPGVLNPLVAIPREVLHPRTAQVGTSDVIVEDHGVKFRRWAAILRATSDIGEAQLTHSLIELGTRSQGSDEVISASALALRQTLGRVRQWNKMLERWGFKRWVTLVNSTDVRTQRGLAQEIAADLSHPYLWTQGADDSDRIRALGRYCSEYSQQADDIALRSAGRRGGPPPNSWDRRFRAAACSGMIQALGTACDPYIIVLSTVTSVIASFMAVSRRATRPSGSLDPNAWLSHFESQGKAWIDTAVAEASAFLPPGWMDGPSVLEGLRRALSSVDRWLMEDYITPAAQLEANRLYIQGAEMTDTSASAGPGSGVESIRRVVLPEVMLVGLDTAEEDLGAGHLDTSRWDEFAAESGLAEFVDNRIVLMRADEADPGLMAQYREWLEDLEEQEAEGRADVTS